MLRFGRTVAAALLLVSYAAGGAWANEKVAVAYTSSAMLMPCFAAAEKGYFTQHGLDVTLIAIGLNSNIPAALMSGSAEFGAATTSVLLQAVEGGIDLKAVAGTGLAVPGGTNEGAVARPGSGISRPQDYIGRRVGVPGMGAIMDVMFRNWLMANQVDPAKVSFIEVGAPQQLDALRGGSVDAVIANDPNLFRLIQTGAGVPAGKFLDALRGPVPIIVYATTGDYARTHRDTILAFQAALRDGGAFVEQHPEEARVIMAQRLHLAPELVKDMEIPQFDPVVSAAQLGVMIDMLRAQQQLPQELDPTSLVFQ